MYTIYGLIVLVIWCIVAPNAIPIAIIIIGIMGSLKIIEAILRGLLKSMGK